MATTYFGETDRTRGSLTYSTSQTSTAVIISITASLQAKNYYGSGYRINAIMDGSTVATAAYYVPDIYYDWTGIVSTPEYTKSFARKSSAYTVTIGASYTGEQYGEYYAGGKYGNTSINITIPALASYTVSYNANGGSGAPSSQTKYEGTTLTLSSTKPTRTGYTFKGWGTSASDTTVDYAAGASYTANASATLYAIWQINTYTVSYNANGGSGAPGNQTKTYGTNLTLSSTVPTRTGHTFKGWATSASGSVAYQPGGTYSANTGVTLYAVWQINTYTISYDKNTTDTVSNMPSNHTKTYGVNTTLSTTLPTRDKYNFLGWSRDAASTVATWVPGELYNLNESNTFYAIWELAYQKPTFSNVEVYRCDENGNADNDGTYAKVKATIKTFSDDYKLSQYNIFLIKNGVESNEYTDSLNERQATVDRIISGLDSNGCEIKITAIDNGGTGEITRQIQGIFSTMDIGAEGKSIAFGGTAPDDNVPENGLVKFFTDVEFTGEVKGIEVDSNKLEAAENHYFSNNDSDEDNLNAWLDTKLSNMADGDMLPIRIDCYPAVSEYGLYGLLIRHQIGYAVCVLFTYDNVVWTKRKYDGTWDNTYFSTPINNGGTGATDAATARANLGVTPENIGAVKIYGGTGLDANTIYDASFVSVSGNGLNLPDYNYYGQIVTLPYRKPHGNTQPDFAAQIYLPNGDDANKPDAMFFRTSTSDSWRDWQEVVSTKMLSYTGISKLAVRSALSNGWVIDLTATASDGTSQYVGFDKTTGIYCYSNGSVNWIIPPIENKMAWKKTSVSLSSGSGSFSASGVTTSSTVICQRGDSAMSGGNYSGVAAADCNSAGTIKIGSDETQSSTWVVSAWWSK